MKIETSLIQTESFSMPYIRFGSGKQPLVLLPGLSVQGVIPYAKAIAAQYKCLCEDFTVYVFERRETLPAVYTVHDMAEDTARALQALGIVDADIYGVSQGGMIALCLAAEHSAPVRKLVLASTAAQVNADRFHTIERWCTLAKSGDAEALLYAFGEAVYPQALYEQYKAVFAMTAATVTDEQLKRFVTLAEGAKDFDITPKLPLIHCQTLIIGAEDDAVLGAEPSREIARALGADARLYIYPEGYGHAVYDTAPDCVQRVADFLKE